MAKGLGKGLNAIFTNVEIGKEEVIQEIKFQSVDQIHINHEKSLIQKQLKN